MIDIVCSGYEARLSISNYRFSRFWNDDLNYEFRGAKKIRDLFRGSEYST